MASEITAGLVGLFCTIVSSIATFMLTKRKYNTEVDSQQIKNMDDSFEVYKKIMTEALKTQDEKIAILQKENDILRSQINQLQMQMISLVGNLNANPNIPTGIPSPELIKEIKTANDKL